MQNLNDIIKRKIHEKLVSPRRSVAKDMLYNPRKESLDYQEISMFIDKFNTQTPIKTPLKSKKFTISDSPFINERLLETPFLRYSKRKTAKKNEGSPYFGTANKENLENSEIKSKNSRKSTFLPY